jgi:glycosyltransferase involved in cell wall biosynthesis
MSHIYNILYIESGTSGGGSFVSLYQHLKVINGQWFHPIVVYLNNNRFIEPVKSLGFPVYVLTDWFYTKKPSSFINHILHKITAIIEKYLPRYYLYFMRLAHKPLLSSLERIVYKEKIDIIHLNVQINRDLFGLFVAEKTDVPCISHLRSMRSGGFDRYRADFANRIVSMFVANSNSTKQHWEKLGIDSKKIKVVYNAINNEQIKPANIRWMWNIDRSVRFVIGCVGNLSGGKGHDFLLQTFARFAKNRSDTILMLVGDGSLRRELIKQTIKLRINDHVIFTGYSTQVQEIIAGFDLLVLPSQTEAFGRVLLEAMQAGTPIVATDSGGIPEVVKHEYNGLLVNYGDEVSLQKAMERVLDDEGLRSKLIENGSQTVDCFSMERYKADLENIYSGVLKN